MVSSEKLPGLEGAFSDDGSHRCADVAMEPSSGVGRVCVTEEIRMEL